MNYITLSNKTGYRLVDAVQFYFNKDPNMVEWFVKMVEERKKQHDCTKDKKNW